MSEPEQCIICLDPLPVPASLDSGETSTVPAVLTDEAPQDDSYLNIIASLDGCEHIIHDACIRSWAQKTNTCPICRNPFHSVRVYNGVDGTAVTTYSVQDKKQVAEFDVQQWLGENPEEEEEETNPCPICNSAEREDILLLCDSCDAAYHTHCIGLEQIPDGDWYCMECAHLFRLTQDPVPAENDDTEVAARQRSAAARRPTARGNRGFHARTRARLRRARRQARNADWQGIWGQFSGRIYEMSDLDLDNHDDEDEDLENFRRFQQLDRHEVQRWQQRMNIAQRLGAREAFRSAIPPQISERLQYPPSSNPTPPPIRETRDERRAWGALEAARESESSAAPSSRKRKTRSVTASPVEPPPAQEPERKLKRPRTRRLPNQGEPSTSASSPATVSANATTTTAPTANAPAAPAAAPAGPSGSPVTARSVNGEAASPRADPLPNGGGPALVSALLKELEPNGTSEDENGARTIPIRQAVDASSPAISPSPSNHSSPRALSLTPPPLPRLNGRPTSPTLSLSTHIEPIYPKANYSPTSYSPNRYSSDHSDSESRSNKADGRSDELRQPRPRRPHQIPSRAEDSSPTRVTMTQAEKKNINDIVKSALRPHWRAQKLTVEQYAAINRDISRRLYEEVKDASSLDGESRRTWEKRASQEVAQAVAELSA